MARNEIRDLENKIEALIIAIPREYEAYEYYMERHHEYHDESSKEMFLFLAKQELKHKEALENILEQLESKLATLKAE